MVVSSDQSRKIWFSGSLMNASEAMVPVLSPAAQFGLSVFEGLAAYRQTDSDQLAIIRYNEHMARLQQSCKLIGLQMPYSPSEIFGFIQEVVDANQYQKDLSIRTSVFVGGEGSWRSSEPVELSIAAIERGDSKAEQGVTACTSTWQKPSDLALPSRVKAGPNYLNGRYAWLEAQSLGFDIPILLDRDGHVTESAGSCVCLVKNDQLILPPLYNDVLESVTRDCLISLALAQGVVVDERPVDRSELHTADELFICGTAVEVTPITRMDRFEVGDGSMGPITTQLREQYLSLARGTHRYSERMLSQLGS